MWKYIAKNLMSSVLFGYTNAHFPDGTVLVIFYYLKSPVAPDGPINPFATMELSLPDGRKFSEEVYAKLEESHYAKDKCDVKIGDCHISGDLKHYDIVFEGKTMSARMTLDGTVRAWRSQTGSIFFGDKEEYYFAWLPTIAEESRTNKSYHDKFSRLPSCQDLQSHTWLRLVTAKSTGNLFVGRCEAVFR